MTDERRDEIMEYGIDPDSSEGFRERLAYGAAPVLVEHSEPIRQVESAKVRIDGEWVKL